MRDSLPFGRLGISECALCILVGDVRVIFAAGDVGRGTEEGSFSVFITCETMKASMQRCTASKGPEGDLHW